jgi:hypothetical protein
MNLVKNILMGEDSKILRIFASILGVSCKCRAEIIPFEPDVDNPTDGKKTAQACALSGILLFIVPLFNV